MKSILNNRKESLYFISAIHVVIAIFIVYERMSRFSDIYKTYGNLSYILLIVDALVILINLGASVGLLLFKSFGLVLSGSYFTYKAIRSLATTIYAVYNVFSMGEFDLFTLRYTGFTKYLTLTIASFLITYVIFEFFAKTKNVSKIKVGATFTVLGIGLNLVYIIMSMYL